MEWQDILESQGVNVPEYLSEQDAEPYKVLAGILSDKREILLNSFARNKIERIQEKIASRGNNKAVVIPSKVPNSENQELLLDPLTSALNGLFSAF
jgi:vacuolar-type H+-ATPase subunit H